jgi:DNA-binding transcriptional LysR family regulator
MMLSITVMNSSINSSSLPSSLSKLDLNLFLLLHTMFEENSTTRAAKRLSVTQSAVSNGLARLRVALGDPLFVRNGRGLVATPRAVELRPLVAQAIGQLAAAVEGGAAFAPRDSTRRFTIAAADNHQVREIPLIAAAFVRELPRAELRVVSADYLAATDGLAKGEIDAAFVPTDMALPGHHGTVVFEERAAMVVRRDHPKVRGKMTPKLFSELFHIDVEVALGRKGFGHQQAARHWRNSGLERHVRITVPYFTTAALVAARTDCVAGLPHRVAETLVATLPIKIVPTTFPLPTMRVSLVWHDRTDGDPGARFFRKVVVEAVR